MLDANQQLYALILVMVSFEDGTKVKSVANRLVIFQVKHHGGTSCTDETKRIVINFNYIDGKDFYTNDLNKLYK